MEPDQSLPGRPDAVPKHSLKSVFTRALRIFGLLAGRFTGTGFQFLSQVLAGQLLGPAAVGLMGAAQGYIMLFGTIGTIGSPFFLLRRVVSRPGRDVSRQRQDWLRFALIGAGIGGAISTAVFGIFWLLTPNDLNARQSTLAWVTIAVGVFSYALAKCYVEYLKGLGQSSRGLMLEFTLPYAVTLLFTGLVAIIDFGSLDVVIPTMGYAFALLIIAALFIRRARQGRPLSQGQIRSRLRRNWKELLTLSLVQVGNNLAFSLPVAVVFAVSGPVSAGLLVIILRVTGLTATISAVFASYFSPLAASAHRQADWQRMRRLYLASSLTNGTACASLCALLIVFPQQLLSIFGEAFVDPSAIFALQLSAGVRLLRHFLGLTEVFLTMSGRASLDLVSQSLSVGALVIGMTILIVIGATGDLPSVAAVVAVSGAVRPVVSAAFIIGSRGIIKV
ncbi:lipopolysaccharide biosynthesis protein [Devosia chinhatensis]|uniref:Polysaccharide biosynthesis protein C-terminal domain-containing protein n=1 Tax=Devosia chinhatensis TaxID=429727 RepID=A0A0F5FLS0_9HYPH|nr:lipopolysaccharide biosynthesis protein [Devosia chinhatensis]KKB09791.1 hypothetical protein VE26_08020 [Devosia chinhatensis]